MWARAFSILFELRARVRWNLKTTIQINEQLDFKRLQDTIGGGNEQRTIDKFENAQRRTIGRNNGKEEVKVDQTLKLKKNFDTSKFNKTKELKDSIQVNK